MKLHIAPLLVVLTLCNAFAQEVIPASSLPQVDWEASQSCRPKYPATAKRDGEQGLVRIGVFVEESGIVSKIQILRSSGYLSLDQAAVEHAWCVKFKPGALEGVPVAMWHEIPIAFQMDSSSPAP